MIVVGTVVKVWEHAIGVEIPSHSTSAFERVQELPIPTGKTQQDYPVGSTVRMTVIESVGQKPSLRIIEDK